jgi:hypothetical protein
MAAAIRTIKIRQFVDSAQVKADLSYSMASLSDAMVRQAALYAHYGELLAKAERQHDDMDLLLDTTEAAVYRKIKDEFIAAGLKTTEVELDKMVRRHERVIAARKALNEAKQIATTAKTSAEAFRHRRDMLVTQGNISREEMKGELVIKKRQDAEASVEDLKEKFLERAREKSNAA